MASNKKRCRAAGGVDSRDENGKCKGCRSKNKHHANCKYNPKNIARSNASYSKQLKLDVPIHAKTKTPRSNPDQEAQEPETSQDNTNSGEIPRNVPEFQNASPADLELKECINDTLEEMKLLLPDVSKGEKVNKKVWPTDRFKVYNPIIHTYCTSKIHPVLF